MQATLFENLACSQKGRLHLNQIRARTFTGRKETACYNRHMTDAIGTALGGIQKSASQFAKSAENVVNATKPGSTEDLAKAIVDGKTTNYAFKANVAVLKTADKMLGTLLDTLA
jgi:hypothetical protein